MASTIMAEGNSEDMHDVSPLHGMTETDLPKEKPIAGEESLSGVPMVQFPKEVHIPSSTHAVSASSSRSPRIFLDICCGVQSPLSKAVMEFYGDTLRFDILINTADDLLDDSRYEKLLRVCASGIVAYSGASPSCCEYSRLKLRPGGPPALRTPEHLEGKPGISGHQLLKVQESNLMLERCIHCLRLVVSSGGHAHLEQPKSAMSWLEPLVQQFLQQESCVCVSIAACSYGKDWHKHWMLASTYPEVAQLASECSHPPGTHQQIAGALSESGQFLSRDTAEYPEALATKFGQVIKPLLTTQGLDLSLDQVEQFFPIKSPSDIPFSRQDGGSFASQADWSARHSFDDCFQSLRRNFFRQIMQDRLDQVILRSFTNRVDSPPFSMEQVAPFRQFLDEFLLAQGLEPNWTVPKDQNLCLFILQHMCVCMEDPDTSLFNYLIEGVPLGIHEAITPSGCFPLQTQESDFDPPLLTVHHTNWSSADEDPSIVQELIDKEVAAGWVEIFPGSLEDAQQFFAHGLAVGKLGLALSDSRPPRLVLDSTVCGVNPQCRIPERSTLPTARDVMRAYPLRQSRKELSGVSFDVRSAHKQVAVHPKYRGYLCFQFNGKLYYYKNCPFGAVISAHFWSRLGGVFQRLFHRICYLPHASFIYVDDMLWIQESQIIGLSAAVIAILCILTGLPISWKKCEVGATIVWIGWSFNIRSGYVTLPDVKRRKLVELLEKLLASSHCSKKTLERFLGLALWITQLWPEMRIWLHYLYRDLHSIPASQFSVDPGGWEELIACVSEDLIFVRKPRFSAIPLNGHLVQVRHQPVKSRSDLRTCALSDKRIWLRVRDPNSSKRKLSPSSIRMLRMYLSWLGRLSPVQSMWPKHTWSGLCVADAYAAGSKCGIGGALFFPSGSCAWFSLQMTSSDFQSLQIPMHDDLQKDISSLETLAQIALVFIAVRSFPGSRIPIKIPTLSDNTGAEAVSNKLFTTQVPLALFLEKLCLLIASSHTEVQVGHIPGKDNEYADALSRWDNLGSPPHNFLPSDRFQLQLSDLWNLDRQPQLFPANTWIPWQLPHAP